ncbi:hypothetical protein CVIRNUC_003725 [Coccomyxa viridis]|uniref:Mediator of RNA polymerase II transcription subunit 25 n=1 Tax=Coccomyxa viridis TaxID=1274662 RepID=A0AAV1I233_9CHLO|nr:hypothetical protein CVIRNUC_003725 [Coccomyxa viridis]
MTDVPAGTSTIQRVCFLIEDTWAIANDWPHLKKCVEAILSRVAAHHEGYCEVALVTFGSAWPYSTCPLQSTHWTQDIEHARQCLDGLRPSLGGCRVQPLLTEALAEAAYLFECPSTLTADSSSIACHCLAIVASEPSKIPVPWPVPEDCHFASGLAGYTELCMALKKRGVEFSFLAPQHMACQDAIARIGRAFVAAQGFKASSEARSSIIDIGSFVRCFLAPSWVLGMSALQQLTSDPAFLPGASLPGKAAPAAQPQSGVPGEPQVLASAPEPAASEESAAADAVAQQPPQQQRPIWQGRMSLGQSVTHGAPQTLWACCALVLGSEAADLALGWPADLIINEVTKSASLIAELKDSSKLRLRGVLQLSEVGELGRRVVEKLAQQQLMAHIDMTQHLGTPASMVVMTLPSKKGPPPALASKLVFIIINRDQ